MGIVILFKMSTDSDKDKASIESEHNTEEEGNIESVELKLDDNEIKYNIEGNDILSGDVIINVTEPKVVGKNITSWVEYKVSGKDSNGSFECVKRYTDF